MKLKKLLLGIASSLLLVLGLNTVALSERELAEKSITIGFSSPVIVHYGEVTLTQQDLETHLAGLPDAGRQELVADPELLAAALSTVYLSHVFYQRATAAGLLADPAVQSQIYTSLAREIRGLYRAWFMARVDEQDHSARARELFLTRPEAFRGPETVDMEHILIPASGAEGEVQAMSRALDLYRQLESGQSFAQVHAGLADHERAQSGEFVLRQIATAELLPQIGALLAQLRPGDLAPPVRTQFGWHLIRFLAINEGQPLEWAEAEGRALRMASDEQRILSWERYLRDLQDTEYDFPEGAIAALRAHFGIGGAFTERQAGELESYLTRESRDH